MRDEYTLTAENLINKLKVEGILFKGFGHIPKFVMSDTDLSIEAKAIYAYFCSFAGAGDCAFPSRNKILYDLNVSKDCYYKHYNKLIDQGYLKVDQQKTIDKETGKAKLSYNTYTLIANPKKYSEKLEASPGDEKCSRIRIGGMKSQGYGTIAKAPMQDRRISLKAKGIYAYFCSFSGAGDCAFPELENIIWHLQIPKSTYYIHYRSLINTNYITAIQRNIDGRYSINDYYINETPCEMPSTEKQDADKCIENTGLFPGTENQDTDKYIESSCIIPSTGKQDTEKPYTEKPYIENQDTNNTNSINTNSIYNYQSINPDIEKVKTTIIDRSMENKVNSYKHNDKSITQRSLLNVKKAAIKSHSTSVNVSNGLNTKKEYYGHFYAESSNQLVEKESLSKKDIFREIQRANLIPIGICNSHNNTATIVQLLSENTRFNEERSQIAFDIFKAALSEMLSDKETRNYGTRRLSNKDILNKVNANINITSDYIIFNGTLVDEIVDDFCQGSIKSEIRNYKGYMKTCIANGLDTYKMKFLNIISKL